ncbi:hypothetical protein AAFC00_003169 [Neodothiora populina]|uniref:Nicotinamide-nucleotide adenylyltransferase n=1 Tax=Neodothiora populina TaxID=2781224 RepID=A0ABR3P9S9_9PEZI
MHVPRSNMRALLPQLSASLSSFQSSSSALRVVKSISASSSSSVGNESDHQSPKTLIILDSSFNPPSKAHLALARSALDESFTKSLTSPIRFMLLFSTHNADKAPSAASFPQRLALMTLFAMDLLQDLQTKTSSSTTTSTTIPTIDIALTNAPYYTDKSAAITKEGENVNGAQATHVHLMGFDTITRFFAAKYYPEYHPPLSALSPFFEAGHRLRVTLRPSDEFGTVEEQRAFIARLADGEMEVDGGKREWAKQIDITEAPEGAGVSSTKVRKAAKAGDWDEVNQLCTDSVAEAVREEAVYAEDARGSKMA